MFSRIANESIINDETVLLSKEFMSEEEFSEILLADIDSHPGFDVEARALIAKFDDQRRLNNLIKLIDTYGAQPALIALANENNILTRVTSVKRKSRIPSVESLSASTVLSKEEIIEDLKSIQVVTGNENLKEWLQRNKWFISFLGFVFGFMTVGKILGVGMATMGGALGGAIGTIAGPAGTVVGAVAGGLGGLIAGRVIGGNIGAAAAIAALKLLGNDTKLKDSDAVVSVLSMRELENLVKYDMFILGVCENLINYKLPVTEQDVLKLKKSIDSLINAKLKLLGLASSEGKVSKTGELPEPKQGTLTSLGYTDSSIVLLAKELDANNEKLKKDAKGIYDYLGKGLTEAINSTDVEAKKCQTEAAALVRDAITVILHRYAEVYKFAYAQMNILSKHYDNTKDS